MSQSPTNLARSRARLRPFAASSVLALAALAGAVVLSGREAKALTCQFDATVSSPLSIQNCVYGAGGPTISPPNYGQWLDTNKKVGSVYSHYPTDKQVKFISGPTTGIGDIEWQWIDVNNNGTWLIPPDPHSKDEWHVDVDFNPDLVPGDPASVFEYIVRINKDTGAPPYNPWFEDVTVSGAFGPGAGSSVKKDIYTVLAGDVKGTLIGSITTTGAPVTLPLPLGYDKLYIIDTTNTPASGNSIDAYQNIYRQQVPGPLPILGAAAAFGSVRKMRKFSSHLKAFTSV